MTLLLPTQSFYGTEVTLTSFFSLLRLFDGMFCIIVMLEKSFWLRKGGQDFTVHDSMHWSINVVKLCSTLSRKAAPTHDVSTSMLQCGDGVLWVVFGFIWPQHHLLIHCCWSSPLTSFSLMSSWCLRCSFPLPLLFFVSIALLLLFACCLKSV